jgi:hypothetical protein
VGQSVASLSSLTLGRAPLGGIPAYVSKMSNFLSSPFHLHTGIK